MIRAKYLRIKWLAAVNALTSDTMIVSIFDTVNLFLTLQEGFKSQILDSLMTKC